MGKLHNTFDRSTCNLGKKKKKKKKRKKKRKDRPTCMSTEVGMLPMRIGLIL